MATTVTLQCGDPRTVPITKEEESPNLKCCFCGRHEVNDVEWGLFMKLDDISTHHFCLLFSANVAQNGNDDEGIQAFLPQDIRTELKRGSKLRCKFCKKNNATVGCNVPKCKYSYHYTCGYERGCLFQFHGQFQSFCMKHKTKQKIPKNLDYECIICTAHIVPEDAVWPPCCGKQLFHRKCIMHTAKNSGSLFKCPLCNSTSQKFMQAMKANGVYVPEQDAEWEREPNAFQELMDSHTKCDAKPCICPDGREWNIKDDKNWSIIRCTYCGGSGTHSKCRNDKDQCWSCESCRDVSRPNSLTRDDENSGDSDPEDTSSPNSSDESDEDKALCHIVSVTSLVGQHQTAPVFPIVAIVADNGEDTTRPSQRSPDKNKEVEEKNITTSSSPAAASSSPMQTPPTVGGLPKRICRPITEAKNVSFTSLKEFLKSETQQSSRLPMQERDTPRCTVSRIRNPYLVSPLSIERKLEQLRQSSLQGQTNKDQNKEENSAKVSPALRRTLCISNIKRNEQLINSLKLREEERIRRHHIKRQKEAEADAEMQRAITRREQNDAFLKQIIDIPREKMSMLPPIPKVPRNKNPTSFIDDSICENHNEESEASNHQLFMESLHPPVPIPWREKIQSPKPKEPTTPMPSSYDVRNYEEVVQEQDHAQSRPRDEQSASKPTMPMPSYYDEPYYEEVVQEQDHADSRPRAEETSTTCVGQSVIEVDIPQEEEASKSNESQSQLNLSSAEDSDEDVVEITHTPPTMKCHPEVEVIKEVRRKGLPVSAGYRYGLKVLDRLTPKFKLVNRNKTDPLLIEIDDEEDEVSENAAGSSSSLRNPPESGSLFKKVSGTRSSRQFYTGGRKNTTKRPRMSSS